MVADADENTHIVNLLQVFTNLSIEKITTYRNIMPQAHTMRTLRNGKRMQQGTDLHFIGPKGARLMTRKDVIDGIEKNNEKLAKQAAAVKKKEERELAKLNAPPKAKRTPFVPRQIILRVGSTSTTNTQQDLNYNL